MQLQQKHPSMTKKQCSSEDESLDMPMKIFTAQKMKFSIKDFFS